MKINLLQYLDFGGLKKCPNSPWLSDAGQTLTFSQFGDVTDVIGTALINKGIKVGDVVAVFIPNGANVLAADFGILKAGGAYMNMDVALPVTRAISLLDNIKPKAVIVDGALKERIPLDSTFEVITFDDLLSKSSDNQALNDRRRSVIDTDPACLIPTSGSTGTPKAVALSHRGLLDFCEWFNGAFSFSSEDVVGSLSPLFFDGYIPGLFMSLLHGGRFVILPRESATFPIRLAEQLEIHGITFIFWVPSTLVPIAKLGLLEKITLPKLRFVGFAGEVMPPSALSYWRKFLPKTNFVNFYGPIEISVICTYFEVPEDFPEDKAIPIGYPCSNTRVLILDENNNECPVGVVGEICVVGSSVALGYWNDPHKTSGSFVKNPLVNSHSELMYKTGDLAFFEENNLISFVGRKDFQIKHQGYRIDLGEIEHIADIELGAKSCCVLYDSPSKSIILFYESDLEISPNNIRLRLSSFLPKYMLPTRIIRLDNMPLNPNGKIDRKYLISTIS